ncbi:MAG: Wzz/FepE/Etk N-terminal domain-containing protein [Acidobacteriota bacterium]
MIEEKPLPWQELLEIFFRRKWLIGGLAAVGFLGALVFSVLTPPTYVARAKILLTEQAVSGPREEAMSATQIKAELHHLKSPVLIREVLEFYQETGQALRPDPPPFQRLVQRIQQRLRALHGRGHAAPPATHLDVRAKQLQGKLVPRSISGTNVIEIALGGGEPTWTARFVNDLVDQHIKRIAKFNEEARASNFYLEQRNLLYVRWKEAQEALSEFRKRHGTDLLSGDEAHLRKVLSQLEADRVATETRVLENEAKVGYLQEKIENLPDTIAAESTVTESDTVKLIKQNILSLALERSELLSRYTPTSTRIQDIERRIEEARKLLSETEDTTLEEVMTAANPALQSLEIELVTTDANLAASQARKQALDEQIESYRQKLSRLELLGTELRRLANDVENKENAHQNYLQKEEEARLSSSLDESGIVNLAIFERAEPPVAAEASKSLFVILGGMIGGIALGVLAAFIRDFLDPRLKGSAQAFRLSGTPIIAEIPRR